MSTFLDPALRTGSADKEIRGAEKNLGSGDFRIHKSQEILGPFTLPPTWFSKKGESSPIESLNLSNTYSHFPLKNDDYGRKSKLHSVFWDLISTPRGREVDVFYPSHPTTFALIFPFGDDFLTCTPQKTNMSPENR